ncbi:MAG: HEAT repeat domain-containing protein [Gemmatimonadaceae bacterium]|nr:HEAT repeat domain-containing protein [Gemmatimonadaceae bacterium]
MFNVKNLVTTLAGAAAFTIVAPLAAQAGETRTPPRPPAPAKAPVVAPAPRPTPTAKSWNGFEYEMDRAAHELARATAELSIDRTAIAEMARASARMAADGARAAAAAAPFAQMAHDVAVNVSEAIAPVAMNLANDFAYSFSTSSSGSRGYRTEVPQPWAQDDPADSLYRDARKALSSEAYRKAADLFRTIREKYPRSTYTPDAPYWEAFALQRLGGDANLRAAREALALQQREYPRAATRGDATALGTRIDGILGRNDQRVATNLRDRATGTGCPEGKEDERVDALNAVMQMDPEQAMPILKKVLARREPCTQQLRRTAVWLVASRKQPEAAGILMNVVKSDPDKDVREQAVFWIANIPTDEAADMLIGMAKSGDDIEMRKRAVQALSRSKSPKAVSTLRELSLDARNTDEVRAEAMNYYVRTEAGKEEGLPFLKDAFNRAESTPYRMRLLSTVTSRRNEEARNFLVTVALDERESMDVRRSAVSMIPSTAVNVNVRTTSGQNVTTTVTPEQSDAVKALGQIYDKAVDMDLRRTALSTLASSRNGAGIDKLLDVARNEKNLELRKNAVSYLTRTKDPRAVQLLQEIIDR